MNPDPMADAADRDFGDDPWRLVVNGIDPEHTGQDESIFALGNGYLGLRGNSEEGLPFTSHGTYVNGLHETWRIQHAEYAYGFAEQGQTIVNVPDGKAIRVYVDDERLNLETSDILEVERVLDLRAGVLSRTLLWLTPTGKRVRVESRRMVSFESRHMATLEMRVTVLDDDANVALSSLVVNRQKEGSAEARGHFADPALNDPRKSETLSENVLIEGPFRHEGSWSLLSYRVRSSGMTLGVGVSHDFDGDESWTHRLETVEDRSRHLFQGTAKAGETLTLVKTLTYHYSSTARMTEMLDRCMRTLVRTSEEPPEWRWEVQRRFLDDFWERSDVQVGADARLQQAIRWNLFQLAQASARADSRGIPAKGVTGSGYSGHYFWDTEIYVLPFLTYTSPVWARNALRQRKRMLPKARERASVMNEAGALFPWRTINGEEASAYYAAGTAACHINADVTYALARYLWATDDEEFLLDSGVDIAVETARLWEGRGFWYKHNGAEPTFHIHGVTGPDEYTTVVNDNLFTNVMARFNLRFAAELVQRLQVENPEAYERICTRLSLQGWEVSAWLAAADGMEVPYSEEMGVHPQDAHFLELEVWDLEATSPEQKPLLLHFHPLVIYRHQVLKQADVVLALLLASNEFSREEKQRNFEYYDALTTGDSTLSAVVQSIIAAEVGYRDLAYRYFEHALRVDLDDLHLNTADGVHIASTGGVWMTLVQGFAGMRDAGRALSFDPRLPSEWGHLSFKLLVQGQRLVVELRQDRISFVIEESLDGEHAVLLSVRGTAVRVAPGPAVHVPLNDQGPDLGAFRGLSAGILPLDGDTGRIITTEIPTRPPSR